MRETQHSPAARAALSLKGAILLCLISQVNISLFQSEFVISAAVMLLPLFVFLKPDYPVLPTAFFSGILVFLLRSLLFILPDTSRLPLVFEAYAPEILFFWIYGLLFSLYARHVTLRPFHPIAMLPLIAIDFSANLCELCVRLGMAAFSGSLLLGVLGAALVRTLLSTLLIWTLDSYGVALTRREDSERYRRLLLMTASLKGELAWLKKNASLIEGTMSEAYSLYHTLQQDPAQAEPAQQALSVAKDIHDVKKEYLLIIRGIDETLGEESETSGMYLSDIFAIVETAAGRFAKETGAQPTFSFSYEEDLYTTRHYTLMGIFQNLLSNAIEAAGTAPVTITLAATLQDGCLQFTLTDTAGGIPEKYIDKVWNAGFSTKMNAETGTMGRGLGLALVKDLVQQNLGGEISVQNNDGQTRFLITLPRERLVDA